MLCLACRWPSSNDLHRLPRASQQSPSLPLLHPPCRLLQKLIPRPCRISTGRRELRQLVRIERIDRPDPGLLAPREIFFLRENLRLRLLTARLALLARDGRTFQSDLKQAGEWLEHYFDTRAARVQEAKADLHSLARLDVMREPVELNETLSALRNFKLARERATR
jgi:uncharacterized protein HemX